jgi:sugar phosphate isomerase/epimerase
MQRRKFIKNSTIAGSLVFLSHPLLAEVKNSSRRSKLDFGVCTGIKNHEIVSNAGYSYIEEGVRSFLIPDKAEEEFEKKMEMLKASKLPVRACNSFLPGSLKSTGPEAAHEKILQFSETAFRRAKRAGVETIVFGSSGSRNIPEGFSREKAKNQFIQLCISMGPIAKKYDVIVVLEPLNDKESNFINTVLEGAEIVESVNHPNIRLLADIYHMKMVGEGPESIHKAAHLLSHTHVAEKEGRTPPGVHNEDLSPYFDALRDIGYKGRMSVEARWDDFENEVFKAHEALMYFVRK